MEVCYMTVTDCDTQASMPFGSTNLFSLLAVLTAEDRQINMSPVPAVALA